MSDFTATEDVTTDGAEVVTEPAVIDEDTLLDEQRQAESEDANEDVALDDAEAELDEGEVARDAI